MIEIAGSPRLVVVDAGAIAFVDGLARAGSEAAIELWEETSDPLAPKRQFVPLPLRPDDPRIGLPGRPLHAPESGAIYLASATAPVLFRFDPATMRFVRGSEDPIVLADTRGDSLNHAAIDERGILYVTAFNEDALYLVDTACDQPLAGPLPLDEAQKRVARHRGGVLLVLGAPGTGRTTTLVEHVQRRIREDGTDPDACLVLGPTRQAAAPTTD